MPTLTRILNGHIGHNAQSYMWTTPNMVFGRSNVDLVASFHPINWSLISRDFLKIEHNTITLLTNRQHVQVKVDANILTTKAPLKNGSIIELELDLPSAYTSLRPPRLCRLAVISIKPTLCVCVCVCACIYVYVCVCRYVYVCISVFFVFGSGSPTAGAVGDGRVSSFPPALPALDHPGPAFC